MQNGDEDFSELMQFVRSVRPLKKKKKKKKKKNNNKKTNKQKMACQYNMTGGTPLSVWGVIIQGGGTIKGHHFPHSHLDTVTSRPQEKQYSTIFTVNIRKANNVDPEHLIRVYTVCFSSRSF